MERSSSRKIVSEESQLARARMTAEFAQSCIEISSRCQPYGEQPVNDLVPKLFTTGESEKVVQNNRWIIARRGA